MMRCFWFALASLLATNAMAVSKDYAFFVDEKDRICVENGDNLVSLKGLDYAGGACTGEKSSVRIRA